ncbi:MAG: DUF932 domain-containing protein [Phascolarctobacterium sp.]|uniref:DUF932 domain-containing protein n=1 Tax=Phascolarctobacterium sp. TaxID=2049039 RepID=UPI0026DD0FA7|nr:DUF932 domain-containing protein [Phascolarctobacterium sp.]MDO4921758.1 DUF932 domain-containing protein [Phascolarctobacterium sp.]
MKQGIKNIEKLYEELDRQRDARIDLIANTKNLSVRSNSVSSMISVATGSDILSYAVSDVAHRQIAERLNIPYKYYERMRSEYTELLDKNINGWLERNPEKRMLRTLDGKLRAFLSDRYRRLDNLELVDHVMPVIAEMKGCEIISCDVTETHLYLKIINKTMKSEIVPGDVVQAGFVISNSEIGLGALKVEPLLYRLICKNGMISKDFTHKKYHTGKQVDDTDNAYELYSDATLEADDKAYFLKVQDIVRAAVDEARFALTVDKMRTAMNIRTGENPVETVEILGDRYLLNKNERGSILRHFIMGNDYSHYGLVNAVTRSSQDVPDYNRATELERIGGTLLEEGIAAVSRNKLTLLPKAA